MSKCNPQYAERNVDDYHDLYLRHVMAMTTEKLHSKASIAAELAWRDSEIERLKNNGLAEMLSGLISKAFNNENNFIKEVIYPLMDDTIDTGIGEFAEYYTIELHSIHMASEEVRVSIMFNALNKTKEYLVKTEEFIEWCDHV